jgi:hypothetical protein
VYDDDAGTATVKNVTMYGHSSNGI